MKTIASNTKTIAALCLYILLAGCGGKSITEFSSDEIAMNVSVVNDPFDTKSKYVGMRVGGYEYMVGSTYYNLRSWKTKAASVSHQVYVTITYLYDWQYFNRARLPGGKSLSINVIDRDVNCSYGGSGCKFTETLGVSISDGLLKRYADSGMKIKFYAKSGHERVIDVKANYIKGHLKAISP